MFTVAAKNCNLAGLLANVVCRLRQIYVFGPILSTTVQNGLNYTTVDLETFWCFNSFPEPVLTRFLVGSSDLIEGEADLETRALLPLGLFIFPTCAKQCCATRPGTFSLQMTWRLTCQSNEKLTTTWWCGPDRPSNFSRIRMWQLGNSDPTGYSGREKCTQHIDTDAES